MAGLIARLTGRKAPATPWDPALAGMGGARQGPGPTGEQAVPGSTAATRHFRGAGPRAVGLRSDTVTGFDQGFEGTTTTQASRAYSEGHNDPRVTPDVTTPRPRAVGSLRRNADEWFGGVALRSDGISPATHAAGSGLNPLNGAAAAGGHSGLDTTTPKVDRQPDISGGVPGSSNVRNSYALRYREQPGLMHIYKSKARPDQKPAGESTDGNGWWSSTTDVMVPSRYKWGGVGGGVQTWSVERQMPYSGRGDGARGAQLSGARYYAAGPPVNVNGGLGDYGVARLRGDKTKRPVSFNEPAPWTSQFYDTTASAGTPDAPGTDGQAPAAIYYSPEVGRGLPGSSPRTP